MNSRLGEQAEREIADELNRRGWWVLRIPRNAQGQQPFDCIAVKGWKVLAFDVKNVHGGEFFPLSRIEPDQEIAMNIFAEKTDYTPGFLLRDAEGHWRWLSWRKVLRAKKAGEKSIPIAGCQRVL